VGGKNKFAEPGGSSDWLYSASSERRRPGVPYSARRQRSRPYSAAQLLWRVGGDCRAGAKLLVCLAVLSQADKSGSRGGFFFHLGSATTGLLKYITTVSETNELKIE